MSRRHGNRVPGAGAMEQRAELDVAVAEDAGHRRPARAILVDEARDDRAVELTLGVKEIVGDPEAAGHLTGVVDALGRAAAPEAPGRILVPLPGPHAQRDADHVVALLDQQRG